MINDVIFVLNDILSIVFYRFFIFATFAKLPKDGLCSFLQRATKSQAQIPLSPILMKLQFFLQGFQVTKEQNLLFLFSVNCFQF